ncbi:hypothetical protein I307_02729 [Cryptococcus deuterogattii 99/473]|uniref:Protein YIP n=1 Tax=Cryptococcus deuterogattii Ram5 TaxID=1296110 RepID=A0A0D0V162_9TREE|nr:hypothetical protein I309_03129 [Cryptococcus deuterogattii LA55]KIR38645.1 hypothetical protein I313_05283 [Cryptococcus deuterogattii Ram5]KIR70830.1 hypothetical protein I310_05242 [Cryptococcus deuterogattii CA1014]KIR90441.1 hypothetical protein I304_05583 [Cryptococcus deuterogattii CBS 10090]KIR97174.1 hypothetical protein L804_05356 [Cryptococcus deuterogattii 2001/935-1]KIY57656.1 hypothetical protein I307_02729 [Cryptococcus deuterogattii 99/473]
MAQQGYAVVDVDEDPSGPSHGSGLEFQILKRVGMAMIPRPGFITEVCDGQIDMYATSAIYVYGLLVPSLLWGATKWLGVGEWGIAEALGIYGYAMSIFIPLSLLCLIPSDNKFARLLVIAVAVLHAAMALTIKILFFGT